MTAKLGKSLLCDQPFKGCASTIIDNTSIKALLLIIFIRFFILLFLIVFKLRAQHEPEPDDNHQLRDAFYQFSSEFSKKKIIVIISLEKRTTIKQYDFKAIVSENSLN
jgi:hypothetical protein